MPARSSSGVVRLTAWDRSLIERYLLFYEDLHHGRRQPTTEAQRHFVRFCRAETRPRTQHEIAYHRYLTQCTTSRTSPERPAAELAIAASPPSPAPGKPREFDKGNVISSQDQRIQIIDQIEEVQIQTPRRSLASNILEELKDQYRSRRKWISGLTADAAMWVNTLIAQDFLTKDIERWMGSQWNTLTDVYTRAMDGDFAAGLKGGVGYIDPEIHRLLEGHTLPSAWRAISDALPDRSHAENFVGMVKALASDLTSMVGLPILTLSKESAQAFGETAASIGIPRLWLNDALHYNALELFGSAIPVLALLLDWNTDDKERFARLAGSLGVTAVAGGSPIGALVCLVVLARSYTDARGSQSRLDWIEAIAHGGILSCIVLVSSAAIAGPAWIGLATGVVLAMVLSDHGRVVPVSELVTFVRRQLTSKRAIVTV